MRLSAVKTVLLLAPELSGSTTSFGAGAFCVVSDSRLPTNSVINPPDTNGFLKTGLRGKAPAESGGVTDFVSFGSIAEDMPEVGGGVDNEGGAVRMGCGRVCGGGSTSGDGWRGGAGRPGRRDTDPVTRPGISSSSTSEDEGDDCRSISTVSEETGLT